MRAVGRTFAGLGLMGLDRTGPPAEAETPVTAIVTDSRETVEGAVFVAIAGTRLDGAEFAQYAIRMGAVGVVATKDGVATIRRTVGELPVPVFIADEPRSVLAWLAAAFYPDQPDTIAAVTGTNGKTSVVHFLRQIWEHAGIKAAGLGTLGVTGTGFEAALGHTTPDPVTLHRALSRLAEQGCTHAAMEASSHGLAQYRCDGVRVKAAALTNITRDHMDYHPTHDAYVLAKMRLFADVLETGGTAVVNADDASADRVREIAARRGQRVVSVGRGGDADLAILAQRFMGEGQGVRYRWNGREHCTALGLVGDFQAENVGIAAALALVTGVDAGTVFDALPRLSGVPGRMEQVAKRAGGAPVYVDYAHTPDALASALDALRPHCAGRLVVVFGAGGDRDPGKRPLMGEAAAARAETVIVTDDNPRSEDPAAIRKAVMEGCPQATEIGDRAAAILAGVDALKEPGDVCLIAGKGHEQGQEIAGETRPFDDASQARASVVALDGVQAALGDGGHGE